MPKLRRAINQARELPLAVEIPRPADPQEALRESQNIAMAVKEVWSRLTDAAGAAQEEQLVALQKESKALLAIRAEAIKLRAGIRLVQRQKDLKRPLLIRYDSCPPRGRVLEIHCHVEGPRRFIATWKGPGDALPRGGAPQMHCHVAGTTLRRSWRRRARRTDLSCGCRCCCGGVLL